MGGGLHVQEDDKFDNHRQFGLMVAVAALSFLRMAYSHDIFSSPVLLLEYVMKNESMKMLYMWALYGEPS